MRMNARSLMYGIFLISLLISPNAYSSNKPRDRSTTKLEIFSSMAYSREGGDFYGLEVTFVPYTGGMFLLWRAATGRIEAPLLLEAKLDGDIWHVSLPLESDNPGTWAVQVNGSILRAIAPNGNVYRLNRVR